MAAFHPTRPIPVPFVRVGFGASSPIRGVVSDWLPSAETRRSSVMGRTSQTDPAPSFTTSRRMVGSGREADIRTASQVKLRGSRSLAPKNPAGAGAMRRSAAWAPTCWAGSAVTQPRGSTSCSPGIGKAGLPDWLHKRCLRGGDHGKRIEGIQASRFI
jgi:hypothetical protein